MISEKDILKLAELAHIEIEPEEAGDFTSKVDTILEYMNKLESIDTENITPLSHVHGINNVFRVDDVESPLTRQDALRNAPDTSGRFIKVPLVIK